jgi:hypothetical protein
MESINVTVREGDSFDELYLAFQKPVGTPRDFSSSTLLAQIKETFGTSTVLDTWNVIKLPATGHVKLGLTSNQTEALARNIALGYSDRDLTYDVSRQAADPPDAGALFLWDLKELYFVDAAQSIVSITEGSQIDPLLGTSRIRVTTLGDHGLGSTDVVRISGTSVGSYNATYTANSLSIVSNTVFEIVPVSGSPIFSTVSSGGTLQVLKEDTIVLGTLQVKPRITSL